MWVAVLQRGEGVFLMENVAKSGLESGVTAVGPACPFRMTGQDRGSEKGSGYLLDRV